MKVDIHSVSDVEKEVRVEIPKEEMEAERLKTLKDVQKGAQVKGFRTGKVPFHVLEKLYADRIDYDLTNRVVEERLSLVLRENAFVPVMQPTLSAVSYTRGEPFGCHFKLDLKPSLEVTESLYKGLPLTEPKHVATPEEVNTVLEQIREAQAQLEPTDTGTLLQKDKGVVGIIEFNGTIDGTPFEGGSAYNYTVELGRGQLLPQFEAALEGLKTGDEKTFPLTFPADYHREDLRGKTAEFKAKILDIKAKRLPSLDDEFGKDVGSYESLDELKQKIAADIVAQKTQEYRLKLYEKIVDHLTERIACPVPQALVEKEKQMSNRSQDEAEKRLKADFILEAIAVREGCRVEAQDLEARVHEIAAANRTPVAQVYEYYQKNNLWPYLQFQVLAKKALDAVLGHAEIRAEDTHV